MRTNYTSGFIKAWIAIAAACALLLGLNGCASNDDAYASYQHKSSAKIFAEAEKHLAHHDFKDAVSDLEALDGLYPFGPYAQQGQLEIIYAYYKDDSAAMALTAAQRYVHLYPRAADLDYAYYMQGLTNFEMGGGWLQNRLGLDRSSRDISNYQAAYDGFATLVARYPRSIYLADSLARMRFIRDIIANHEYEVAEFYWKRQAYVAAANRATGIVQHFQGAAEVIPAWGMLVRCNRRLGLQLAAKRDLQILAYNYPNSKTYKRLRGK